MSYKVSITDALSGPFSAWLGEDVDWSPWSAALKSVMGEALTRRERLIFQRCTGLDEPPDAACREAWLVVGRKGRKSAISALLGCYAAAYGIWHRAAGERLRVLIVAASRAQAAIVKDYAEGILQSNAGLARLIENNNADGISLTNGVDLQIGAASFRTVRGPTIIAAILDEVAFWRDEHSANPDTEIYRAIRPAMITHRHALLVGLSSPYARRGLLYEKHRDHFGKPGNTLVWQAPTLTMNPDVDREEIRLAYAEDEAWAVQNSVLSSDLTLSSS